MHASMETPMSHIVSSERTSRLPRGLLYKELTSSLSSRRLDQLSVLNIVGTLCSR